MERLSATGERSTGAWGGLGMGTPGDAVAATGWKQFDELKERIGAYLKSSEAEFGRLIEALDGYGEMERNVQRAKDRLEQVTGTASFDQIESIRNFMLEGCTTSRQFLQQIAQASLRLTTASKEAQMLLGKAGSLERALAPVSFVALQIKLEGTRLSAEDQGKMRRFHDDMHAVLARMKAVAESQAVSMQAVLAQFASAKSLVVELSSTFAPRAIESEKHIQANLATLGAPPAGLVEAQTKASALQAIVAKGIREEVKILQGHDAIRQRVEHLLSALGGARQMSREQSGQVLVLERQQARAVHQSIVATGKSLARELQAVMGATESIAAARDGEAAGSTEMERFEASIHLLESLSNELAEMLVGEARIGGQILRHVGPIQMTLSARSEQMRELALAMRQLAFNVQLSATHMPLARGLAVLGRITSEVADEVLRCAADLNTRFIRLGEMLQAQVDAIAGEVRGVEGWSAALAARPSHASLLDGRRAGHEEVSRMHGDAGALLEKTKALLQSLRFADEGEELFRELDIVLESLISCYPKCELVDAQHSTVGYTMQAQHDVHAMVFGSASRGGAQPRATRLTEVAPDDDLGDNVELF